MRTANYVYCVELTTTSKFSPSLTAEKVALVYQGRTSGFCRTSVRDAADAPAIVAVRRNVLHSTGAAFNRP